MRKILPGTCAAAALAVLVIALPACQRTPPPLQPTVKLEEYGRPLPPGDSALRLVVDPAHMPDLAAAYRNRDALLLDAIGESEHWFAKPSSKRRFPFEDVTHERARTSLVAFRELLESAPNASAFAAEVRQRFDVYQSIGYDQRGTVLYTGYYSPIFQASRTRTTRFGSPLYDRPADLVTDELSGEPRGRRTPDGRIVPYHDRREIETRGLLAGTELVWLENDLAAYIIHVNGSAKLRLQDGTVMFVGYGGKTDRPYASLGQAIVEAGLIEKGGVNLARIKRVYRENPDSVRELMFRNRNYVFFKAYPGDNWPAGSLGAQVTAEASLATDKKVYPRGGLVLVDTKAITFSGGQRSFLRFMLDQDTGGAIEAPGRADIFMGIGPGAEILAGSQYAEGRLYYLFLKPRFVEDGGTVVMEQ